MIPKPGKKPQLDAFRSISLRSCVGKLMEHVILKRLHKHIEGGELFPHTMIGFRPHLLLKTSNLDTRSVLGLDSTKAFDTIKHEVVLDNLEKLGVGKRTYHYIQGLLNERTAKISIGGVESNDVRLGGRGTPQGSVLSPYVFNVAIIGLLKKLEKIEGL
ncbi:hypothetical protein HPB47_013871 [Ixodes persulcatus]|uniref:Uncharacterized protein n=1 Tax=Ixodes persulcatus TaxID=34615 RepID=A0AC60QXF7_IXOPE|nr:hypothetical protein HPB47_013871 [Ixodes persulcatus]